MNFTDFSKIFDPSTVIGAILLGVVASIVFLGMQRIFKWLQLLISNILIFNLSSLYTLNGYWASIEKIDNRIKYVNYNKVIQRKQRVHFYMWQYSKEEIESSSQEEVDTSIEAGRKQYKPYYSEGIMRGNHLSAYFYSIDKNVPETGALTLKLEGQKLVGRYIQFSVERENAPLIESPLNYFLKRIELSKKSKIRMFFGRAPFSKSADAFSFIESHMNRRGWRS